jgi:hypothetical protein
MKPLLRRPARTVALLALALGAAACIEFVEPDIPQAGAPAVLEVSLSVSADTLAFIEARLTPGFDGYGFERRIADDTLHALGRKVPPESVTGVGTRLYRAPLRLAPGESLGPLVIVPPVVEGTSPPLPIRWGGMRRLGGDTLALVRGEDLRLHFAIGAGAGGQPQTRQWFLQLSGATAPIRVSSDGPPPAELIVPWQWVPAPFANGSAFADLTFFQNAARAGPAGDYLMSVTVNFNARWVIRVVEE